jgi:hypothetical protein
MNMFWSLTVYVITFLTSTVAMGFSEKKKNNAYLAFLALVIPSLTATFRTSGIDFWAYKDIYTHIQQGGEGYTEILWNLLNRVAPTFHVLLFTSAFLFLFVMYIAIRKFIKHDIHLAWFIVLVLPYMTFYNAMRQMLAVAFVFLAFAYFAEARWIFGSFWVLIGTGFHKTAILVTLAFVICLLLFKKVKRCDVLIFLFSVLAFFGAPLALKLARLLGMFEKYSVGDMNFSLGFLLYTVPPLFFFWYKRKSFTESRFFQCLLLYLLTLPFQFLGFRIAYADRFMLYSQAFIIILVPMIVQAYDREKPNYKIRIIYYLWFAFNFFVLSVLMNSNGVFPYCTL